MNIGLRRACLLWGALLALLCVAFVADNWVMARLEPIHDSIAGDLLRHTVRWLGTGYVQAAVGLMLVGIGWAISPRLRSAGLWTLLAFAVAGITVNVLKPILHRARPYVTDPPPLHWTGYFTDHHYQSFPSAETATTFAVTLMLAYWYPLLRWPLLTLAFIIGVARVFVGAHHPSDIVAGAMLGLAVAQLLWRRAARPEQSHAG